jgi:hypothetical protein
MARYIKCDCCGKKINFGDEVYKFNGRAGLYCSGECFADSYGEVQELDMELDDYCYHTIYDDDARKEEIRKEMEEHRMAMEKLFEELKTLTAQN